jgi:hypothetical protein
LNLERSVGNLAKRIDSLGPMFGHEQIMIQYPCQVVNKFQCPYERINIKEDDDDIKATNYNYNVKDLFRLHKMTFFVEIALANSV